MLKIVRAAGSTHTGREIIVWHVVEENGEIMDTFSRLSDAKYWLEKWQVKE